MGSQNSQHPNRSNITGPASHGEIKTGTSQNPGASGAVRHRTRAERVAAHFTYYGLFQQIVDALKNVEMRKQITLVVLATLAMCIATKAWNPPFPFVEYEVPDRDIVCWIAFSCLEEKPPYAVPSPSLADPRLRRDGIPEILNQDHDKVIHETGRSAQPGDEEGKPSQQEHKAVPSSEKKDAASEASRQFPRGRIISVVYQESDASLSTASSPDSPSVRVFSGEEPSVAVEHLTRTDPPDSKEIEAEGIAHDLRQGDLPTKRPIMSTVDALPVPIDDDLPGQLVVYENGDRYRFFKPGTVLVKAGQPIMRRDILVLQAEFAVLMSLRTFGEQASRFCGVFFLTLALFLLAFVFLRRRERRRPKTSLGTSFLYALMVITVIVAGLMHGFFKNGANLELIPILIFSQGVAIAFSWELALVLTVIVSFVHVLSQANPIFTMVLLVGVTASIVIHLGRLRSRTRLIVVGSFGALIAFLLTLFIKMTEGQEITRVIMTYAVLNAFWTCAAAFLMTGLLPFIERPCGILTDMSLLELGDPSHPLLHELTRRAPATYSHSLQVASIAETAAESIGARGLLVRVGAYFHDIGKILNPDFFTENQQVGHNVHDHLEPRMSTLVIVAHVKDGVDLVRQHRVPQPIIDLVEQHHGTSLVSFFHTLAAKQNRDHGYGTTVDEGSFRYPGPKPQSKESGILMIADAAESACRSLREATPGKIEAMVRHISEDKLKDGQFDESGLTLRELRTIENSIINSILAMRHNRISYPDATGRKSTDSAETKPHIETDTEQPR